MRLIDANTYALEEFHDSSVPSYAILSHTWETEEVLFKDMNDLAVAQKKRGFPKIQYACAQARKDHLSYVWVDTCCIDKSSSAELQEAINSMFQWYANAVHCYVYLSDILGACPELSDRGIRDPQKGWTLGLPLDDENRFWHKAFSASKWFTRGWTLQELIAPKSLLFYGGSWNPLGNRYLLRETISRATSIDSKIFLYPSRPLSIYSVAQRMAWAAQRKTSRVEDRAYSLLGLFGVNMPMLYGEGTKSFLRLQEEIMKVNNDHTILAWNSGESTSQGTLLAESPADFLSSRNVVQWGRPDSFEMTNRGLRISLPLFQPQGRMNGGEQYAILNCRDEDNPTYFLALRLLPYSQENVFHLPTEQFIDDFRTRLTSVEVKDLSKAKEKTNIVITRDFEQSILKRTLWLNFSGTYNVPDILDLSCSHGEWVWQGQSAIVNTPNIGRIRARALLRSRSGMTIFVAFGFNYPENLPSVQPDSSCKYDPLALGVWLSRPSRHDLISGLMNNYSEEQPRGFSDSWYSRMQSQTELRISETHVITANIYLREILGDEVIVCTVRVAESASNLPVEIYSASHETSFAALTPSG